MLTLRSVGPAPQASPPAGKPGGPQIGLADASVRIDMALLLAITGSLSSPQCCWSAWGDKTKCGGYPTGAAGGKCISAQSCRPICWQRCRIRLSG